jgi:hypothetical protein
VPLDDLVLKQPVGDDHIRPEQLLPSRHLLKDGLPVMDDELEVEVRDPHAGVAVARRGLADVASPSPEAEVAALDGVEEHRPIELLDRRERESGIAFELGQPEVRAERGNHRADEVGEDVLGVVELDVGEVAGVSGDVGDQEARRLGGQEQSFLKGLARPGRAPLYGRGPTGLWVDSFAAWLRAGLSA